MTVQVNNNNWPLMIVNPSRESALQKETVSHFPAKNLPEPRVPDSPPVRGFDASFEKGVFVDIYA